MCRMMRSALPLEFHQNWVHMLASVFHAHSTAWHYMKVQSPDQLARVSMTKDCKRFTKHGP